MPSIVAIVILIVIVGIILFGVWLLRAEPRLIWGTATSPDQQMPSSIPTGKTVFIETPAGGINRFELFYREAGTQGNPVVVLLHGLAGSGDSTWFNTFAALSAAYRVIAPDLRGHGLSFQPSGPSRIEDIAQDVLALIRQLEIKQFHLMGHSMGGMVAISAAHLAPEQVLSLTLIDTSVQFADTRLWRFGTLMYPPMVRIRNRLSGWTLENRTRARSFARTEVEPQFHQWVYHKRRLNQPESLIAAWWALRACDGSGWLVALRMPTLILVGEHDALVPERMRQRLVQLAPHAAFITIKGADHYPQIQFAAQVNPILLDFLAAHKR